MTRRGRANERGAALLVVMVAVAVVTVLAADLAYDTQVSLRIAGNARDELRAMYLAKSGVALQRLVLSFQQDLDSALPKGLPGQLSFPRPQIWQLVPVSSTLAASLFQEAPPPAPAAPPGQERPPPGAGAGPPPEGFEAIAGDEGRKVNAQLDSAYTGGLLQAQVQGLWQLVCDPRWDALFDREDENGQRYTRQDLLVNLKDWVDLDEQGSALAGSFPSTCVMITPLNPFEQGFADENFPYDRGEDRYRAKNARMDSLAEMYLVAGVTDAFMAAFGDRLTVYLPRDEKRNVNTTDRATLLDLARSVAEPPSQPVLYDPEFADRLQKVILEKTFGGLFSITPQDFGQVLAALGVKLNQNNLDPTSPKNPFTDRSRVFEIRATGRSGDVAKVLEAVVRFDSLQPGQTTGQPGQQGPRAGQPPAQQATPPGQAGAAAAQARALTAGSGTLGQLVHWREN